MQRREQDERLLLDERGQVDLVDMQTFKDGNYRYMLHYIEYLLKFHVIRPLQRKTATEDANQLLLIFLDFGAPHILQSDNGREFTGQVIQEFSTLWSSPKSRISRAEQW